MHFVIVTVREKCQESKSSNILQSSIRSGCTSCRSKNIVNYQAR